MVIAIILGMSACRNSTITAEDVERMINAALRREPPNSPHQDMNLISNGE